MKKIYIFFIIFSLTISNALNVSAINNEKELITPYKEGFMFEEIGNYYFNNISGANNKYHTEFNISNILPERNEAVIIPGFKESNPGSNSFVENMSAERLEFDYADSKVVQSILTINFLNVPSQVEGDPKPIILKLSDNLKIEAKLQLSNYQNRYGTPINEHGVIYYDYDVSDFISDNGEGIYAIANIPHHIKNNNSSGTEDSGMRWNITSVLESPEIPVSYAILAHEPMYWRNSPIGSKSFTIKNKQGFKTNAYGEVNASLLLVGQHRLAGSSKNVRDGIRITQRKNGIVAALPFLYFNDVNTSYNLFNGIGNSTKNGKKISQNYYPSLGEESNDGGRKPNLGPTKIIDNNFGKNLANGIDEIKFDYFIQEDQNKNTGGGVSILGVAIEVEHPTYKLEINNEIINNADYQNGNYYYESQTLKHSIEVLNESNEDHGLYNTYLEVTLEDELSFDPKSVTVNEKPIELSKIEVNNNNNIIKIYIGDNHTHISDVTLPNDLYTIKFESKINKNINSEELLTQVSLNGHLLVNGNETTGYFIKNIKNLKNSVSLIEKPIISAEDIMYKQYEAPKNLLDNPTLKVADNVFKDAKSKVKVDQSLVDFNQANTYPVTYSYRNLDNIEVTKTINVTITPRYYLNFETNGGSSIVTSGPHDANVAIEQPEDPINDSSTFIGWYEDKKLSTPFDFSKGISSDKIIYAKYEKNKYTTIFDSRGGNEVPNQIVKHSERLDKPKDPIREGYAFKGWFYKDTLVEYDFNQPVQTDLELEAHWSVNEYTVTFDSNTNDLIDSQLVEHNGLVVKPSDPTRKGFSFEGWFYKDSDIEYNFDSLVTSNLELEAHYSADLYIVEFETYNDVEIKNQVLGYMELVNNPGELSKHGYSFGGWYNSLTNELYDFSEKVSSNLSLHAHWIADDVNVKFDSQGGTLVTSVMLDYGTNVPIPESPTREGYIFVGWFMSSDFSSIFNFNQPIVEDITLFAGWIAKSHTITFNSNGGSLVDDQLVKHDGYAYLPINPTKKGLYFAGWFIDEDLTELYNFSSPVNKSSELFAKWSKDFIEPPAQGGGGIEDGQGSSSEEDLDEDVKPPESSNGGNGNNTDYVDKSENLSESVESNNDMKNPNDVGTGINNPFFVYLYIILVSLLMLFVKIRSKKTD